MPIKLFYEFKKCEDISYADPFRPKSGGTRPPRALPIDAHAVPVKNLTIQHFGKRICHHSNGNKLHKMHKSAASVIGDKPLLSQERGESATQISSFKMCLMAKAYYIYNNINTRL